MNYLWEGQLCPFPPQTEVGFYKPQALLKVWCQSAQVEKECPQWSGHLRISLYAHTHTKNTFCTNRHSYIYHIHIHMHTHIVSVQTRYMYTISHYSSLLPLNFKFALCTHDSIDMSLHPPITIKSPVGRTAVQVEWSSTGMSPTCTQDLVWGE